MERQLQERLIGATVLMIVAVLVVPELLSGPKPVAAPPAATASDGPPSPGEPSTMIAGVVDVPRATLPSRQAAPKPVSVVPPVAETRSVPLTRPPAASPPRVAPAPAASTPIEANAPAPVPQTAVASISGRPPLKPGSDKRSTEKGGWTIQVGSYAKSATAKRIAKDLQNHGFAAVVLPVDLQGKRLYRVRVGPAMDRKTADQTLRRVQRLMPSSRLVGNP